MSHHDPSSARRSSLGTPLFGRSRPGRVAGALARTALFTASLLSLPLSGCVESDMDESEAVDEAEQALSGRDVGRAIANPNAQLTGRWLLNNATAPAGASEFTSPISTPDGRLTLSHVTSSEATCR